MLEQIKLGRIFPKLITADLDIEKLRKEKKIGCRVFVALLNSNCENLRDLEHVTSWELLRRHGFGRKSLNELIRFLDSL